MQLDLNSLNALIDAAKNLDAGFSNLPPFDPQTPGAARITEILTETATRLHDNYPYHHPLYAGQMLKPPHPVARLAYALAMFINPNNHALDGGRATSALEKEAVAEIAAMFGWQNFLGHLTGGGTMANLEALWIAGQLAPGKKIVASEQSHYTHHRISSVLKLDFESIPVDTHARLDLNALENRLKTKNDIGTVIVTMGTTATGSVDPLPEILNLRDRYNFRIHADAAYGGYFTLAQNLSPQATAAFAKISEADSIVIDPHKHGLQPYGCGCVLFRDPSVGRLYKHDSPYTYFSSAELHLGEISLECSRPGAAAAALWATQKLLPLTKSGEFASGLEQGREAALALHKKLRAADDKFIPAFEPELDIVIFAPKPTTPSSSLTEISGRSREIFDSAAAENLHLALAELPVAFFAANLPATVRRDKPTVIALRSVLMKPEHAQWLDQIYEILISSL
ncbi:MAG TPA: aminotransferase class I/II-fold pyridoxal phosphate-dependent enzyme [Candidatus Acidoferrum sp.]